MLKHVKGTENRRWKLDKLGMEIKHSRVMSYLEKIFRSREFHQHSSLQSNPVTLLHGPHGVKRSFESNAGTIGGDYDLCSAGGQTSPGCFYSLYLDKK